MSWLSDAWHGAASWVDDTWEDLKGAFDEWTDIFVESMDKFWAWFGDVFLIAVGLTILITALAGLGVFAAIWAGLTTIGGWIAAGWAWVSGWGAALAGWWDEWLWWLNWDNIKRASDIGEIISPEYREAVADLYGQIADVSEQLGLGSGFMLLALSDARNLILDASSLMGRDYDIGEVSWVSSLTGYLGEFNEKAESFHKNPEGLILDIQAYFEPDIINTRTGFQRTLVDFMGTSIKGIEALGGKLVKLKGTLEQSILHLPEKISRPIYEKMKDDFEAFDGFMDDKFTPAIEAVSGITDILTRETAGHRSELNNIEGLMANPGKILGNIDALSDLDRLEQETQITEIATRAYSTGSAEVNQAIDDEQKELAKIAEALKKERKSPPFLRLEYEGYRPPISIANGVFTSWQVGDY